MANLVFGESTNTLAAGSTDDIIIKERGMDTGTITIDAGAGDDVVYTSHDQILVDTSPSSTSITTAADLDPGAFWSTLFNPDVGNDSIPYTPIVDDGDGSINVYSVTASIGDTITPDLDYGYEGPGNQLDAEIFLTDSAGNSLEPSDPAKSIKAM